LRELKKLSTRKTIERVALALFAERGFEATSVIEIAEAAEIAPSTLHGYFPSKEDIVFWLYDEGRENARKRIIERPATEDTVDALDGVVGLGGNAAENERQRRHDANFCDTRFSRTSSPKGSHATSTRPPKTYGRA
jgi:AcrR family transcriptional regulator